jgi:hypothetical protein
MMGKELGLSSHEMRMFAGLMAGNKLITLQGTDLAMATNFDLMGITLTSKGNEIVYGKSSIEPNSVSSSVQINAGDNANIALHNRDVIQTQRQEFYTNEEIERLSAFIISIQEETNKLKKEQKEILNIQTQSRELIAEISSGKINRIGINQKIYSYLKTVGSVLPILDEVLKLLNYTK